jgi:hypothetical protein
MFRKQQIHTEHYSGNVTEWYIDVLKNQVIEVKTLIDHRTKEYHYDLEHFLGEGRNGVVCQKLKEHRN